MVQAGASLPGVGKAPIYFGPVSREIAAAFAGEDLTDEGEREFWTPMLSWPGSEPGYSGGEVSFQTGKNEAKQVVVRGGLVWGEDSEPGVDWRPFAKRLRAHGVGHDFIRSERRWEGERDGNGQPIVVDEKILVRWRPGMDDPHEVGLDGNGQPQLNPGLMQLLYEDGEGVALEETIAGLLGAGLGRLNGTEGEIAGQGYAL